MEEVGDMVDAFADAAAAGTDYFSFVGLEVVGSGGADQGLWGGEEAGEEGE